MKRIYFLVGVAVGVPAFFLGTLPHGGSISDEPVVDRHTQSVTLTCNVTGIGVHEVEGKSASFIDTEDCGKLPANAESFFEVRAGHQYKLTTGEGPVMRWIIQSAELVE